MKGQVIEGANGSSFDCSALPAGAHLITLEVVTEDDSSTEGANLIRLPADDLTANETASLPPPRLEWTRQRIRWLALHWRFGALCFHRGLRRFGAKQGTSALELPALGPPQVLADGSPDTQGLPTTLDDQGVLWRQHPGGEVDWWTRSGAFGTDGSRWTGLDTP